MFPIIFDNAIIFMKSKSASVVIKEFSKYPRWAFDDIIVENCCVEQNENELFVITGSKVIYEFNFDPFLLSEEEINKKYDLTKSKYKILIYDENNISKIGKFLNKWRNPKKLSIVRSGWIATKKRIPLDIICNSLRIER